MGLHIRNIHPLTSQTTVLLLCVRNQVNPTAWHRAFRVGAANWTTLGTRPRLLYLRTQRPDLLNVNFVDMGAYESMSGALHGRRVRRDRTVWR